MTSAAERWAAELAAWRIDPEILDAAPDSPFGFPPALFAARDDVRSPLPDAVRDALPPGGSVLDVGAGAGATSLELAGSVGQLHAVDEQASMLEALTAAAAERGVPVSTYVGRWPDCADTVPVCDVVVCGHVLYNVPDLVPFATELTRHARHRVAVELLGEHPWTRLKPMWETVHHQPRPDGPTAELAVEVLQEAGIDPEVREVVREPAARTGQLYDLWVDFTRRQLCLPPERRDEVEELMRAHPPRPRRSVVLTWPGQGEAPRAGRQGAIG